MLEVAEDDGISGDASQPSSSSSSSSLYAPKPAYDQLEVYSSNGGGAVKANKQRRSGLSALHQAEILSKVSTAAASGATNGRSAPSSSSDAAPACRLTTDTPAAPVAGGSGRVPTTPALPAMLPPTVMALIPPSTGARSKVKKAAERSTSPLGSSGSSSSPTGTNITVEVTTPPAMEHEPLKPSSSCSTSSLTDSSASVASLPETNGAQTQTSTPAASVPWPELPQSPTMARLQDAGLPPSTPISKLLPHELEAVFRRVELGLKIDRVTLFDRLEVLRRQRDTAHANYYRELDTVNSHMMAIDGECVKGELGAELGRLKRSLAVLAVAVESLVTSAQQWAAVQHEWSCSRAVEALQIYTDHTIALLAQANKQVKHLNTLVPPPAASPRLRATSLNPPLEQRRLSLSPGSRAPGSPRLMRSTSIATASRRASLQPNIKPFKEPLKSLHLSGGGGGVLPALNLARVSSIVEEGTTESDQEASSPGVTSPPSLSSAMTTSTAAASSTSSPCSSRNSSTTTTTTGNTVSVANRQSVPRLTLRGSSSGGGDAADGEQMDGNTDDLTEEALTRLQIFYRRALERPQGDTDDLLDDEFLDPEDDELVDLDDDLMDELLEYESSHQNKSYSSSPGSPGTTDSIYEPRLSTVVTSVCSWLRGIEQWPWSQSQTAQGTRYFLCCALLAMALVLLVAVTLSCPLVHDERGGLGCRQGWQDLFSPCRPFVQLTYIGHAEPPTKPIFVPNN